MIRPLPFVPESLTALRARYADAVAQAHDATVATEAVAAFKAGGTIDVAALFIPGQHRRHVFDFPDGYRLVVSAEKIPDVLPGGVPRGALASRYVHVSGRNWSATPRPSEREEATAVLNHARAISGITAPHDVKFRTATATHFLFAVP